MLLRLERNGSNFLEFAARFLSKRSTVEGPVQTLLSMLWDASEPATSFWWGSEEPDMA